MLETIQQAGVLGIIALPIILLVCDIQDAYKDRQ